MFRSSTNAHKTTVYQSPPEAGTSRQESVNPGLSAAQAIDSRCSSPDLDTFLLAMSPEGEIDDIVPETSQNQDKSKPKAKGKAAKAEKPPNKSLPVDARTVKDVRSMNHVITTLARQIINSIREGKSVTSGNKKYIIEAAEEISLAADIYLASILEPGNFDPPPDTPAPAPPPPPVDSTILRTEIATVMREEMNKLKSELKEQLANSGPTYAQVASSPPEKPSKSQYKPAIIVSPVESTGNKQDTINKFKKSVSFRTKNYAPTRVKVVSNNKVRVEFVNESQCQETLNQLKDSTVVSAEPAKKLRPMLILKGVSKDIPLEELSSVIVQQNSTLSDLIVEPEDLKLRFRRNNNRNPNLYNAVFIVSPPVWREATNLGRLNVDHQQVFVGDFSPFMQCYKCLQFGHIGKNCMSDCRPCSHCSDKTHQVSDCPHTTSTPVCFNCSKYNVKTNSHLNINHSATSANCPTIQYIKNQLKCKIDFGI